MVKVTPDGGLHASSGGESFGLRPVGVGRSRLARTRPGVVRVSATGARDDLTAMSVWYRSGRWGIEQGFTIARRPAGTGVLRIVMRTGGSMVARLTGPGAVSLQARAGHAAAAVRDTLTYGGLAVTDTAGRRIPAHLALRGSRLQIVVSDSSARYPLTVDPTLAQQQELTGSDTFAGDGLGQAVTISSDGTTALVGAPVHSSSAGAVYVFTRSGTIWTQQQELTAADAAAGDSFGDSVALSSDGSTALIGADAKASATGAAYVFTRSGTTWTQQRELTASADALGDDLGVSVALSSDGSTALVGAAGTTSATGAAYVFSRSGTTWTRQQRLTASDGAAGDRLGSSAALSSDGSMALIGAPARNSGAGAVYAFTRAGTTWTEQQELTAADAAGGDRFGTSAALSADGSTALIGAGFRDSAAGAAYVDVRSGATWTEQQVLAASDGAAGDLFGGSVALSGDGSTALVGAAGRGAVTGAAYVFAGSGATWTERQTLIAGDGLPGDAFGVSVALPSDGTTALIGANGKNAAYAFGAPMGTATAVSSSEDPSSVGDQVTYTATVTPTPDGGTVAFTDAGTTIAGCDAAAVGANGTATCQASYPDVGSHGITAAYAGDPNFRASASAPLIQTVGMAATATALASSANPAAAGDLIAYTATVSPTPDAGTVAFTQGGAAVNGCDAVAVDGNGSAICETSYVDVGSRDVTATYTGDDNFGGSVSAPLTQTVAAVATATTLASSADPSEFGQQVRFTATVSPTPDGGTVAFTDDSAGIPGCGAVAVDTFTGLATCQTTYTDLESHAIDATYSGDANYETSAAPTITQTVGAAATATALASFADPSAVGVEVTFTATVTPIPDGGSVAFADGGATIAGCAAVAVDPGGLASCQATYSAPGQHDITAAYSGDGHHRSSGSSTLKQTVTRAATATALASSTDASAAGRQVTFTATVSPTPDGGTVAFTDAGTGIPGCGAIAMDGDGRANCQVAYVDVGTHLIAAAYAGNANYQGSASTPLTQTVDRAATATTLSSDTNPSTAGRQVTYTATVTPTPDSGTVAFTDAGTTIAGCDAVAVDGSGSATCPATYAAIGSRSIVGTYSGDPNHRGSTSAPLTQAVTRAATATALSSSNGTSTAGRRVTFTATVTPTPGTGTMTFTDAGAAIAGCGSVGVDGNGQATCQTTYADAGTHAIAAAYSGDGNFVDSASSPLTQTVARAATATTLSSDTNPSTAGRQVTYTATVTPTPDSGTVAFTDAGTTIAGCDAVAVDGSGSATCPATYAAVGSHSTVATYSGDANHQPSGSIVLGQTVTRATTATTVASSSNPSAVGRRVTYSANVSPMPDGGTVAFTDAGGAIAGCAAAQVGVKGNAACQITYPGVGSHAVTATYSGDPNHHDSASSPLTQTVTPASTATALASSADPSAVGGQVTYTATVTPTPDGGAIAFTDAGTTIAGCDAVTVSGSGSATCQATYAAIGSHPVTAAYSGDAGHQGSAAPVLAQTVGPAATATALASSADTADAGRPVTFTATVTPTPDGGTIRFADAGNAISRCGAVAVDGSGQATCTTTYSAAGGHAITADYSGDANYQGSAPIVLGQIISRTPTATTLESSSDPSAVGDQVTYTANVSPTPDSGTIAFTDNGASIPGCDAATVDADGNGTCQVTYSRVASRQITARYSGDANHRGSASVVLIQSVDIIASGTALGSSANPSTAGQPITFTATVTPTPGGGTIDFTDGGTGITGCGGVAVDAAGQAACHITYPAAGSHSVVAAYSGDPNDQGSTSFTLMQTVAPAATATTLASSSDPSAVGDRVTYTANVSPTPTGGTVAFTDAGTTIAGCGAAPVGGAGNAVCQVTYSRVGAHPITATYSGAASNVTSTSSPLTQSIGQRPTAVGLRSSGDPSQIGDQVTYTANVSPTPDGGTVGFTDDATGITGCGAALVDGNGNATCQTAYSAAGSHPITATYSGDTGFQAAPSAVLTETVNKVATTTALESSGDPSRAGDQVTYTATVSPTSTGGTVAFTDGGVGIPGCGGVPVGGNGAADCPAMYSGIGTHAIAAAYSGAATLQASTSASVTQAVGSAMTTTVIASSSNPSEAGARVTYTVTVSPAPGGGTVAFTDAGTGIAGCGAVTVAGNGTAACQATYTGIGTHQIGATYSGDPTDESSASAGLAQAVGTTASVTTLASSGDPSAVGTQVTYTAAVSPVPAGGTVAFADGAAGIAGCGAAAVDGSGNATCQVAYPAVGAHSIVATYAGDANTQGSTSSALGQRVAPALTTTALSSARNPSAAGGSSTFTATVSPTPTGGTVAFTDAGTTIPGCGAVAVDGNGQTQCQTIYATVGSHAIVAGFSGDGLRGASTSQTLTQTVAAGTTATALGSSGDPSRAGGQVTYTANVSPAPGGGTVAFSDGAGPISGCAGVAVDGNGNAACRATYTGIGTHPIAATYSGDADHQGSSSSILIQTVTMAPSTTALQSSADPSAVGDLVVYTATIAPAPGGGRVAFSDAGTTIPGCNAVAVDGGGAATCRAGYSQVGLHPVTAAYSGDPNSQASASAALTQAVIAAATTTILHSSGDPSGAGGRVTYTATVSPAPARGATAFTDGGAAIAGCESVAVDGSGRATCSTTYPAAGPHAIVATYSGDDNDQGSASVPFTQRVAKAVTATRLSSSGDPSPAGRPVTFTATVSPTPTGGTVAFTDAGTAIAGCRSVALDGHGQATCQTTYPAFGARSVLATYSGDADHLGSTSQLLAQDIGRAVTATVLRSSANPSGAGAQVTYTASVSPTPDGGTIAFTDSGDGITGCAAVPVNGSGRATCRATYPAIGTHTIVALYSGDGGDQPSPSRPLTQTVAKAVTTTALASSANPAAVGGQVTYTATVTPAPAAGAVAFTDGGDAIPECGPVPVDRNGRATCRATYAEVGSHAVTATYSGDTDSTASTSVALSQAIAAPLIITPIKSAPRRIHESYPAVSAAYMAWSHTSRRRPRHYSVYEQAMSSNRPIGPTFRVNPAGSFGYAGGIAGTRLAYEQVRHGQSNIRFWNLAYHRRSSPGPGVNTKAWEKSPTITAKWLLFGRLTPHTARVLLYNLKTHGLRELAGVTRSARHTAIAGQVNGNYATYRVCRSTCTAYRYNIATGHATALPRPAGTSNLVSAVSSIGTVYFIQGHRGCESRHRLMQQTLGGAVTELQVFSPQVTIGKIQTYTARGGTTELFYSRTTCAGRAVHIYRLTTP